ncbi:MAG: aspartate aminotransferase [Deltaproteobacteria bacterium]|nr:aspartate aminotransferase [Deltaproteobacteria bacterium]
MSRDESVALSLPRVLNSNLHGLGLSSTLWINERSRELEDQGRRIFRLGLGQSPFPVPETVAQALRDHAHEKDYLPVLGLPELRAAVVGHHKREQGLSSYVADDVMVGPGSKELLFLLQLAYHGDLLLPNPSWVSYAPQARIIGRQVQWLETLAADGWLLDPELLAHHCGADPARPRILLLNYPNNPTGNTYSGDELESLARVAREHNVVVLADEIYGHVHHEGAHRSIAEYYPEGTILSGGLSKWCGAGGWRLGTFTFPQSLHWLRDAMASVASETFTSTSAPIQYAAVRAFEGGPEIDSYLRLSRQILTAVGARFTAALQACGAQVVRTLGGFYSFPDFSPLREQLSARGIDSNAVLAQRALDEVGVAFLGGTCFGRPSDELTARLAYVNFDGAEALRQAADLQGEPGALPSACDETVEAVELLADWVAR